MRKVFIFFLVFLYACTPPSVPIDDLSKFYECSDGKFVKLPKECFINKCDTDANCAIIKFSGPCGAFDVAAPRGTQPPTIHATRCNEQGECRALPAACVDIKPSAKFTGVACAENKCVGLFQSSQAQCTKDSDCVRASCCHPSSCVHKSLQPDCQEIVCTMECMPGTLDCGGTCVCGNGKCAGRNYYSE